MLRTKWQRWLGWGALGGLMLAGASVAHAAYDFAYRLWGDRRVAPIQIFDDGRQTWLQFSPGQVVPAVFAGRDAESLVLAPHVQQGPYLVLEGTAARIELRIAEIVARADYAGDRPRTWGDSLAAVPPPGQALVGGPAAVMPAWPAGTPEAPVAAMRVETPSAGPAVVATVEPMPPAAALEFDAALADGNIRRVLERWARAAGWWFQAEHWAVDVDIPLIGAASFGPDFRNAVRGLLASTELGERPLQPCFYANRVLRVVSLSQACDRTLAPAAVAGDLR
ncbi:MAG: TcpQ domain-containing protein [Pigmentiphaga sp.]